MVSDLKLRLLGANDPDKLARELSHIINSSEGRFKHDFPGLAEAYAAPSRAEKRIANIQEQVERAGGKYVVYTVRSGATTLGLVTCQQRRLWARAHWFSLPRTQANGPLVAGWLDPHRLPELKGISRDVLRLVAGKLAEMRSMSGAPWTVVRESHPVMHQILQDPGNGFGGFVAVGGPRDYSRVSGIEEPSVLYVANYAVRNL